MLTRCCVRLICLSGMQGSGVRLGLAAVQDGHGGHDGVHRRQRAVVGHPAAGGAPRVPAAGGEGLLLPRRCGAPPCHSMLQIASDKPVNSIVCLQDGTTLESEVESTKLGDLLPCFTPSSRRREQPNDVSKNIARARIKRRCARCRCRWTTAQVRGRPSSWWARREGWCCPATARARPLPTASARPSLVPPLPPAVPVTCLSW